MSPEICYSFYNGHTYLVCLCHPLQLYAIFLAGEIHQDDKLPTYDNLHGLLRNCKKIGSIQWFNWLNTNNNYYLNSGIDYWRGDHLGILVLHYFGKWQTGVVMSQVMPSPLQSLYVGWAWVDLHLTGGFSPGMLFWVNIFDQLGRQCDQVVRALDWNQMIPSSSLTLTTSCQPPASWHF